MGWYRFNQDFKAGDELDFECFKWTHVMPGDVVQSAYTIAFKQCDFIARNLETKTLKLMHAPILVLARIDGVPGEDHEINCFPGKKNVTFVCLSRHGIIIVPQQQDT